MTTTDKQMTITALPCKICGSAPVIVCFDENKFYVKCPSITNSKSPGYALHLEHGKQISIELWNREQTEKTSR